MCAEIEIERVKWLRPGDDAPMELTVHKVQGGIMQRMYLRDELVQDTFSPRPYQLGQACDGTIDDPVHGLFILYCRAMRLDAGKLYQAAYPDECGHYTLAYQEAVLLRARDQGIAEPAEWTDEAFKGLLESLGEINNHQLAQAVTAAHISLAETGIPNPPMQPITDSATAIIGALLNIRNIANDNRKGKSDE